MDIAQLQLTLRQFAADRDWERYHSPKNLAMALSVEAAELTELYQWLNDTESEHSRYDPAHQQRVGEELADILLYAIRLADRAGVDLERAIERKLMLNAQKYPATR